MKKILSFILTLTLTLGTASAVFAVEPPNVAESYGTAVYTDIKITNWAYPAVKAMSEKNIVKGYPDGTFKPANTLTYGEFIKMVVLAEGITDPGNATGIDKITGRKNHWAMEYFNSAIVNGLIKTYKIASSKLGSSIPREDMAIIISAALGEERNQSYEELKAIIDKHDALRQNVSDVDLKMENEYDIMKSYAAGILTGYEDGSFKPEGTLTRAESAAVVYRLTEESKRILPKNSDGAVTSGSVEQITAGGVTEDGIPLTGNVADIVKNYDSFTYPNTGAIDENLRDAKTYVIVTDARPYRLSLKENRGTKWVESTGLNLVYLMKDGKITEGVSGNRYYETDITKADYIVSVKSSTNKMLLIPNPFKK